MPGVWNNGRDQLAQHDPCSHPRPVVAGRSGNEVVFAMALRRVLVWCCSTLASVEHTNTYIFFFSAREMMARTINGNSNRTLSNIESNGVHRHCLSKGDVRALSEAQRAATGEPNSRQFESRLSPCLVSSTPPYEVPSGNPLNKTLRRHSIRAQRSATRSAAAAPQNAASEIASTDYGVIRFPWRPPSF